MDQSIFLAMSGAQQTLLAQALNAHNLANVSTVGFRADLSQFRSMPLFGETFNSRVFAEVEAPGVNLAPGALETTGRELDIAVNGAGWIAVQAPDGSEAYTRAGDLQIASVGGVLETGAGHPVLGDGARLFCHRSKSLKWVLTGLSASFRWDNRRAIWSSSTASNS